MKKIMIVDDHPIVLQSMKTMIEGKNYKVVKSSTSEQAISLLEHIDDIDLVICDLSLPEVTDGLKLIQTIQDRHKSMPVIVFTMHEELWNIKILMELNVNGIVLKCDDIGELFQAIKAATGNKTYLSTQFCKMRDKILSSDGILSIREIGILRMISAGSTNPEISYEMGISEKTIEFHRKNIRQKLGVKTMAEATKKACMMGLLTIMLLFAVTTTHAQHTLDIYRSDSEHHAIDEGQMRQISFDDTEGEWMLVAELTGDSILTIPVTLIDSICVRQPILTHGDAVDLGLSVLWANRNLGADHPEESGGYYAFGETTEKETYTHENYIHSDPDDHYGFFMYDIGREISGTDMDAAHLLWGNGWRIPTLDECTELAEKCTCRQLTYNGIKGILVIGTNGNTLFLPYAGTKRQSGVPLYNGTEGVYVSGSSDFEIYEQEDFTITILVPYGLAMQKNTIYSNMILNASLGYTIRPVCNK